ncbi:GerAB/ArcD/ProY family transporter [Haloimpatiens sp. FM7330]|uniref:GerAB/ArcD/ProY family transporter n=1 Tax=Haloimpatiens sp. FM7330 TaxID=3298610 RepID=UPI00362D910A
MDKDSDSILTPSELTFTITGFLIGPGVLVLPLSVVKAAQQDGWICCILGSIYPLYMAFLASYVHKKYPKDNILTLSKKFLGKFLGTVLNFLFLLFFLFILTQVASAMSNVLLIYMTPFLNKYKIILIILLVPAFIAYKGIKTLGRVNVIIFYIVILGVFIPIPALKQGSFFNIMPVFGSGFTGILKGSKETILAFSGAEALFLISPFFKGNKEFKKSSIKGIFITILIYTWFTFISIYYLGIDTLPKFLWPVVTVSESVIIPVINNFRYIFMSLWLLLMLKTLSTYYYLFTFGLNKLSNNISLNRKKLVILLYPLFFYISTKYGNPTMRRNLADMLIPIHVIFNTTYVSLITFITIIKKGDVNVQKI